MSDSEIIATAYTAIGTASHMEPGHWLIWIEQDGARGGLRVVDGQLVFEGDHVAESARFF